jgi:hypothetical protein
VRDIGKMRVRSRTKFPGVRGLSRIAACELSVLARMGRKLPRTLMHATRCSCDARMQACRSRRSSRFDSVFGPHRLEAGDPEPVQAFRTKLAREGRARAHRGETTIACTLDLTAWAPAKEPGARTRNVGSAAVSFDRVCVRRPCERTGRESALVRQFRASGPFGPPRAKPTFTLIWRKCGRCAAGTRDAEY